MNLDGLGKYAGGVDGFGEFAGKVMILVNLQHERVGAVFMKKKYKDSSPPVAN